MSRIHRLSGPWVRRTAVGLILGCAAAGSLPPAQAQVTVESLTSSAVSEVGPYYQDVEDAINRFFSRDVAGARALLQAARKKTPKLAPPEVMLAQMFIAAGQLPGARQELELAVRQYPNDPEAYLLLADIAVSEQRATEAGLLFAKASELAEKFDENPKRKQNFQIRGFAGQATVNEARENWAAARENLEAWIKLEPNAGPPRQRLARVLFQLDQKKEAYAALQAASKADPKLPPAEVSMGSYYAQSGDKQQAEKFMEAAAKRGADDLPTNLALVQWNLQSNDLDDAKKFAEQALKIDPASVDAMIARGVVARMQKDFGTAQKWLEAAHTKSPGNSLCTNQLALVLLESDKDEDRQRALAYAELNQKLNPNNAEAAATLGWVAYRLGRKADATRALNAAMQGGIPAPESAYYVAYVMNDQGQTAAAAKLLESALSNDRPFAYRDEAEKLLIELRKKNQAGNAPADGK